MWGQLAPRLLALSAILCRVVYRLKVMLSEGATTRMYLEL
jgi:hypothetical protein